MAPFDPSHGLAALSADAPAGKNLEFDPAFAELERLAQGKPEQQYGATIVPAEPPDWKNVVTSAWALLERSYDLRIMALLAVGRLQREGLAAYAETLAMIQQLLQSCWAEAHPQLDPDDDNDPTLRANALLAVAEPGRVLRVLRHLPLASARAISVSWRDIAVANGTIEAEAGTERLSEATIAQVFHETDQGALAGLRAALEGAIASAVAIPELFDAAAGYGTGPDFGDLLKLLRDIRRLVQIFAPADGDAATPIAEAEGASSAAPAEAAAAGGAVRVGALGPITNRADAVRLLDLVVTYYERHEPSSPLPLLIGRARRLADKGFLDILRDLAPDGLSQAERIVGSNDQ